MEVREVKDLFIVLNKEEYQNYLISSEENLGINFEKLIKHIQMFNIIDILDFAQDFSQEKEGIIKLRLKVVVK